MNLQPTLENEFIRIRPLEASDLETLFQVAKDPLIWEQHPSHDRWQRTIYEAFFKDSMLSKGALIVINKTNNEVIGSSRFNRIKNVDDALEIGWSFLARTYWGGTFNRYVKSLMMDHAFQFVHNIIFYIGKDNIRSQRAVQKLGGARETGVAFAHLFKEDPNDWTFRISKQNWFLSNHT